MLTLASLYVSGFMSNMQRNQAGSQFASPQSGPPVSPHHAPGGPVYPGMGPYSQSGPPGPYGPQGSQYGHQGRDIRLNGLFYTATQVAPLTGVQ